MAYVSQSGHGAASRFGGSQSALQGGQGRNVIGGSDRYGRGGQGGQGNTGANRMGVVRPVAPPPVMPMPVVAPPMPQVPMPPNAQPPIHTPYNPATTGWNSLPMGPPQTTPSFVQPRSLPVTNMPNTSYPAYNPNSPPLNGPGGLMNNNFSQRGRASH